MQRIPAGGTPGYTLLGLPERPGVSELPRVEIAWRIAGAADAHVGVVVEESHALAGTALAGAHLVHIEGLGDVIIGAQFQADDAVDHRAGVADVVDRRDEAHVALGETAGVNVVVADNEAEANEQLRASMRAMAESCNRGSVAIFAPSARARSTSSPERTPPSIITPTLLPTAVAMDSIASSEAIGRLSTKHSRRKRRTMAQNWK